MVVEMKVNRSSNIRVLKPLAFAFGTHSTPRLGRDLEIIITYLFQPRRKSSEKTSKPNDSALF